MTSAYLLVTHGSRDRRPQIAVEQLANLVKQQLSIRKQQIIPLCSSTLNRSTALLSPDSPYCSVKPKTLVVTAGNTRVEGPRDKRKPLSSLRSPKSPAYRTEKSKSLTEKYCPESPILIETASLELTKIPLGQRIEQVAQKAKKLNLGNIKIIPLFLLPGVHVREDIPREVAIAQKHLGAEVNIKLNPYLGSYQKLPQLFAQQFGKYPRAGRILMAHGSRYPQAHQPINAIAEQLQALNAYWFVAPSLNDQIRNLVNQGKEKITIVPYFLFTGGITNAIAEQVKQLQLTWPQVELQLGHPLGATPELAQLIVEEIDID